MERHPIIEANELLEQQRIELRLTELRQLLAARKKNKGRQLPESLIRRAFFISNPSSDNWCRDNYLDAVNQLHNG